MSSAIQTLYTLAQEVGVLTSYHDWKGNLIEAKPDVLARVLALLGLDIASPDQAADVLRRHRSAQWESLAPSCAVAWDGHEVKLGLRVNASDHGPYSVELELESGETRTLHGHLGSLPVAEHAHIDGRDLVIRALTVPVGTFGYHQATIEIGKRRERCFIISAPTTGYQWNEGKRWGVFAPLYAVRTAQGSSAGDLGDLVALSRWTYDLGGRFVGTLPLLSAFLTEPFEPSPYSPVSRMFWNELYLDLASAPGLTLSPDAQAMVRSPGFEAEARALRNLELVDYRRQMAHKRGVLEALAETAWASGELRAEIEAYMQRTPRADDYARFRAVTEARGKVWTEWPEPLRSGTIGGGDFDERARRYHLYVQYAMDEQLSRMDEDGMASLYLDLPVGVNRGGYDVWRDRDAFVLDAAAGAPPDPLFSEGQNWGLPPLHPQRTREHGHRYFIDCIRHHVRHAGLLRVDHAMGLHRLFWIPQGAGTKDGIYVHYPAGEMYAIISLESHRHACAVVGEDLGTVPDYVRPAMKHHGLARLYVAQFNLPSGKPGEDAIEPPPAQSIASLNTHDTPTFNGYWHGSDIDDFLALGIITHEEAAADHATRRAMCQATARILARRGLLASDDISDDKLMDITGAMLELLATSDAEMVLVNLEDLWLEAAPHNVPGTLDERPNWRRRMRHTLGEITADERVVELLRRVEQARARRR